MSSVSYFPNSKKFSVNTLSISNNTFIASDPDVLQYLRQHAACGAMHDSDERYPPPKCHPGTRQAVRDRITGWYGFKTRPEKGIMWVHGPAGYGKSAVAQTVSDDLEAQQQELEFNPVGATFFFWRTSPERNSPARFVITLAYQLAISIPELLPHIGHAITHNPMILKKSLEVQLARLIVKPFRALDNLDEMPNRLIIIDGLDECINSDQESRLEKKYAEDQERVQIRVLDLIHTLQSHKLPLSFLIFSRPEVWIKQHMDSRVFKPVTEVVDLYKIGDNLHDVEVYLKAELSRIAANLPLEPEEDGSEWPGQSMLQRLLRQTRGHMVYASTVIRHIDDPYDDPRRQLEGILEFGDDCVASTSNLVHSSSFSALHELYRQILRSCPEVHRPLMLEILEGLIALPIFPLGSFTISTALTVLDRLRGRAPGQGMKAIRNLRAVTIMDSVSYEGQFFVHSSFPEFLRNPEAALEFTIDLQRGRQRLFLHFLSCISSIDLSTDVDEEHIRVALRSWPEYWRVSSPLDAAEYATQLKLLLGLNLKACIVQGLKVEDQYSSFSSNLSYAYRKTVVEKIQSANNEPIIGRLCDVALELDQHTAALEEECASFMNSSFEQALAHLLQPAIFQGLTSFSPAQELSGGARAPIKSFRL
ncbi:hypothetical protein EST38_g3873 [Candolleomyces aberdarensis]|uniref:Nephrocystin 3-like N-terminal domain-containing protein n=1 Tax=Candolleomyces aberdarensis TaxID=2316362 RepID=A0A4Q2DPI0_9AGAR|nr:hypothetical protein EST38_g3873 [Candolleomyces aberdarensis]